MFCVYIDINYEIYEFNPLKANKKRKRKEKKKRKKKGKQIIMELLLNQMFLSNSLPHHLITQSAY